MYALWPIRRASSPTCAWRRPDISTTSAPARSQACSARTPCKRERLVGAAQQRRAGAEQRAVEVDVEAAHGDIVAHAA